MKQHVGSLIIALAIAAVLPSAARADMFDAVADFNQTGVQPAAGNPWTYGTEVSLNNGFALLPNYGNTNCSITFCTNDGTTVNDYYLFAQFGGPSVAKVATGGPLTFPLSSLVLPNNVLDMLPGSVASQVPGVTDFVVTRFTAPSPGMFHISGGLADLQQSSVGFSILVNGATVFSDYASFTGQSIHQGTIPFSIDASLTQGTTVDFIVDSLGSQGFDNVGLTAQINGAPGPVIGAGLPGLLAGIGALLAWYRKRQSALR